MVFKKIDPSSKNSITNALQIFDLPDTNVSVTSSVVREYLTLNPITDTPYHFKVHPSSSFIDLSKCYILTEMKIQKKNAANNVWENLVDADNVATINLIGATWIKNLKVSIQGREVYDSNSLYAYRTYFDTVLTYSQEVKNSYLQASGYFEDASNQDGTDDAQTGYKSRKALFKESKTVQFITRIDADVFNQEKYMINGIEIDIQLTPNDNNFMIIQDGATDYKLEITACKLYVKTLEVTDGLALDIQKRLENKWSHYGVRKSIMKSIFISAGRTEYNGTLFTDQLPRRVVLGMLDNAAYVGDRTKSPFNFKPFNIRSISLFANGKQWPAAPFELDFVGNQYTRAFHEMYENLSLANSTESNGITLEKYRSGWTFFVFNMTHSMEDNEAFDLVQDGTTLISLHFKQQVPAGGIVLIAMGEMDGLISLDKNRSITSDTTI